MDLETASKVFEALGHPARIAIVLYVARSRKGVVWGALWNALQEAGMRVDERQLNFHLLKLVESGVLIKVRVGKGKYVYKLNSKVNKLVKLGSLREALINSMKSGAEGSTDERAPVGEVHTKYEGSSAAGEEVEGAGAQRD